MVQKIEHHTVIAALFFAAILFSIALTNAIQSIN
jgi:hypothetical protein